jgi:hypothetical protein
MFDAEKKIGYIKTIQITAPQTWRHFFKTGFNPMEGHMKINLQLMENVKRLNQSEIQVSSDALPTTGPEVWGLSYAC